MSSGQPTINRQDLTRQLLFRLSSITEGQLSSYESRLNQQEN